MKDRADPSIALSPAHAVVSLMPEAFLRPAQVGGSPPSSRLRPFQDPAYNKKYAIRSVATHRASRQDQRSTSGGRVDASTSGLLSLRGVKRTRWEFPIANLRKRWTLGRILEPVSAIFKMAQAKLTSRNCKESHIAAISRRIHFSDVLGFSLDKHAIALAQSG